MQRRDLVQFLVLAAAAPGLAGCGGRGAASGGSTDTVLGVARRNGLDRFLRAVEAAGLTETLSGPGPFTVFAPDDAAFRALPRGEYAALLRPENRDALADLVAYHVVPGTFTTAFLAGVDVNYTTAAGTSVNVDGTGGLRVGGAEVVRPDLEAANGVVHVIDAVLAPR